MSSAAERVEAAMKEMNASSAEIFHDVPEHSLLSLSVSLCAQVMQKIRTLAFAKGGSSVDVKAVFDEFDADGSGEIDELEFRMAMISLGVQLSDEECDVVFRFFDRDGGGVEFAEFQAAFDSRWLWGGVSRCS